MCIRDSIRNDLGKKDNAVAVHELFHFLSNNGVDYDIENDAVVKRLGLEQQIDRVDSKDVEIRNRGLDEGLTEYYARKECQSRGLPVVEDCYVDNLAIAKKLEQSMGSGLVAKAYFEGRPDLLEQEFNNTMGDDRAWNSFSEHCDTVLDGGAQGTQSKSKALSMLDDYDRKKIGKTLVEPIWER
jgi:hypothetical protein